MMKVWQPDKDEVDQTSDWSIWNKEVSEFPWYYSEMETCYILSGEAEVEDSSGQGIHFKEGDMVSFEKGLQCTWKIKKDISKRFKLG
jgi:uncharacterized cupin superfamily protein